MTMSRRMFLQGAGAALVVAPVFMSASARAQAANIAGLSGQGMITITSTGVTVSQQAALESAALQIAKTAPSRAAANATLTQIARTVVLYAPRAGIWGLAAGLAVGGAYWLATGQSPLDFAVTLAAGQVGIYVKKPCSCAETPMNMGSYPDTVTMGFYKLNGCSDTIYYRASVVSTVAARSNSSPGPEWSGVYTQTLSGGQYRHFYTRAVHVDPVGCQTEGLHLPSTVEYSRSLSSADKLKTVSAALMSALGLSAWKWTSAPITAGGGDYGGAGAASGWFDPPQALIDEVTKAPLAAASPVAPLNYFGSAAEPSPITVSDLFASWPTGQADPGQFQFSDEVRFPGESGYQPPEGPEPEEPEEPTEPEAGEWDWTKFLPNSPNFNLPSLPDLSFPALTDFAPPSLGGPALSASCADPSLTFSMLTGAGASTAPHTLSLPLCSMVDAVAPVAASTSIIAASIHSIKKFMEL